MVGPECGTAMSEGATTVGNVVSLGDADSGDRIAGGMGNGAWLASFDDGIGRGCSSLNGLLGHCCHVNCVPENSALLGASKLLTLKSIWSCNAPCSMNGRMNSFHEW